MMVESLERRCLLAADLWANSFFIADPTVSPGGVITVQFQVTNSGQDADATNFEVGFYWSTNPNMADGNEVPANLAGNDPYFNPVAPNRMIISSLPARSVTTRIVTIAAPDEPPVGSNPYAYLGIRIDETNAVAESDEGNNHSRGEDFDSAIAFWMSELYSANMSVDPGWFLGLGWAHGTPAELEGDPSSGFTGSDVIGFNLQGRYPSAMGSTSWAQTPAISTEYAHSITLSFRRWLGVERAPYDNALIQASTNGSTWTTIWSNPTANIVDDRWVTQTIPLPPDFAEQPAIYIRFGMGSTDAVDEFAGWNIDDVVVRGVQQQSPIPGTPDLVSDTGVSADDNLVNLNNSSEASALTFVVPGTVAGATVKLFADGQLIGSAIASGEITQIVTNGTYTLTDGSHQVFATQKMPTAAESRPSDALAIAVDTVAPILVGFQVNNGHAQRSMVRLLRATFSEAVVQQAILLGRDGQPVAGVSMNSSSVDGIAYSYSFSGDAVVGGSLPEGHYRLLLEAGTVTDLAGNAMSQSAELQFHRLFGDIAGDRAVDAADVTAMRQIQGNSGAYVDYLDYDGEGDIDSSDLAQLLQRLPMRRIP